MKPGELIYIDDGLISLKAETINADSIDCIVVNSASRAMCCLAGRGIRRELRAATAHGKCSRNRVDRWRVSRDVDSELFCYSFVFCLLALFCFFLHLLFRRIRLVLSRVCVSPVCFHLCCRQDNMAIRRPFACFLTRLLSPFFLPF